MNLFDTANYAETEPSTIIAGDRLAWKRTDLNDYDNTLYTLSYKGRLEGDGTKSIAITAAASGSDYLVEVAAATTAAYDTGTYHWSAYITRDSDSERVTIDSGTFKVVANKASSTVDPRTHAKKTLDAIEAVLENRATQDQMSYSIQGRSLSRMPIEDLIKFRDIYRSEVRSETLAENIANGMGGGKVTVRL